jgi:hypothetical protein
MVYMEIYGYAKNECMHEIQPLFSFLVVTSLDFSEEKRGGGQNWKQKTTKNNKKQQKQQKQQKDKSIVDYIAYCLSVCVRVCWGGGEGWLY